MKLTTVCMAVWFLPWITSCIENGCWWLLTVQLAANWLICPFKNPRSDWPSLGKWNKRHPLLPSMSFPGCKKSPLSFRVSSWFIYTCVLMWCSSGRFYEIQKTLNMHYLSLVWWENHGWQWRTVTVGTYRHLLLLFWIRYQTAGCGLKPSVQETHAISWFTLKAAILFWLVDKSAFPEGDGALDGTRKNEHRLVNVTEIAAFRFPFQISRLWKQSALWYVSSTFFFSTNYVSCENVLLALEWMTKNIHKVKMSH